MRYSEDEKKLYDNGKVYRFVKDESGDSACAKCAFHRSDCLNMRCYPDARIDRQFGIFIETTHTHQVLLDGKKYDVVAEVSKPSGHEGQFEGWEINIESVTLILDKETEEEIVSQIKNQENGIF